MSVEDADFDAIVIGAGVVGLAVARALALAGRSVATLEAEAIIGSGTSSRNSEVIHGGLYYPAGSAKAKLCVEGRRSLYEFCAAHGVPHRKCGKLIVACDDSELSAIAAIAEKGRVNGVEGLRFLSAEEARAMEPALQCVGALLSPETGIVDSHAFMLALQGEAEDHGAVFAFRAPFLGAEAGQGVVRVRAGGDVPAEITARALINCAGLAASEVALAIEGLDAALVPRTRYAKGNYFALNGRAPFRRLIYPAPQAHGLGVHLTLDMAGQARFGPDVEWIDAIDYDVDPRRCEGFYEAIRRYWPQLPDDALAPAYAGIRPKLGGPEDAAADFRIDAARIDNALLINLYGIESPGLTASLAIAAQVAALAA